MTILSAISAKIEPYSVSDEALELAFIESSHYFGLSGYSVEDDYDVSVLLKSISLSAMKILSNLKTLSNENLGGVSNSYDTSKIDKMIRAIASSAGISSSLVGVDDISENTISIARVW